MSAPDELGAQVLDMRTRAPYIEDKIALEETGGTGGNGPMDPGVNMKEYVDARDDAVESRLSQKLDKLPGKGTIWAAVATTLGIVFAVWAIAGDRFDSGLSVSPILQQVQAQQAKVDDAQNAKLDLLDDKLDILLERTADGNAQRGEEVGKPEAVR